MASMPRVMVLAVVTVAGAMPAWCQSNVPMRVTDPTALASRTGAVVASPTCPQQGPVSYPTNERAWHRLGLRLHGPLAAALGSAALSVELLESRLGPTHCRFCDTNLNRMDAEAAHLKWSFPGSANALSAFTAYGLVPALSLGFLALDGSRKGGGRRVAQDTLIVVEAVAASALIVWGVKCLVARPRPDAADHPGDRDSFVSFPSGHTAFAWSLAVASGTLATLRQYPHRWHVWALGLTFAALTGYLRVAAFRHYPSDVMAGAAMGAAVGAGVAWVMH